MDIVTEGQFLDHIRDLNGQINALQGRPYSDIVDAEGHQYIDLVMEGGGTLGLALLGYLHVLEQAGLRFIGIGGTSAGAISAIALAAAATPAHPRVSRLLKDMANMPMASFVDGRKPGDDDAMDALQTWLDEDSGTLKTIWKTTQVLDNLREIHALNRGDVFHAWMDQLLKGTNGGHTLTVATLRQRMNTVPDLFVQPNALVSDFQDTIGNALWEEHGGQRRLLFKPRPNLLCVIAADISTETKVKFPEMADLYWEHPDDVNVADFARASMSIPGFFATFQLKSLPTDAALPRWRKLGWHAKNYEGDFLPSVHHFVDGGVLSNFPIDAFHEASRVPLRPTLGVKLQWDEHKHEFKGLLSVIGGAFNTARHAMDAEFIKANQDYGQLVAYIDTGEISWLDFGMTTDTKLDLFRRGATTAIKFLQDFDWEGYKGIRRKLVERSRLDV
jgi:NTE family protein